MENVYFHDTTELLHASQAYVNIVNMISAQFCSHQIIFLQWLL